MIWVTQALTYLSVVVSSLLKINDSVSPQTHFKIPVLKKWKKKHKFQYNFIVAIYFNI